MGEILAHLKSPGWWFTVVVGGIVVGLVVYFLAPALKRTVEAALEGRRLRKTEAAKDRNELIERLKADPHRFTRWEIRSPRIVTGIRMLLLVVLLTILYGTVSVPEFGTFSREAIPFVVGMMALSLLAGLNTYNFTWREGITREVIKAMDGAANSGANSSEG